MKKLALAASMLILMTISGQAFAETAASSNQQAASTAAFDRTIATDTAATAYQYHGGPKYND